ncbi:hypothetical protein [Roseicella frigidaeris]|uniref:hypothetical protein n=1 Tax=Roseicella frigidaeris TaxID=2230885 RepID=UPI000FDDDEB2|nr:hypothetical protein [Roseicella frigidaeris]
MDQLLSDTDAASAFLQQCKLLDELKKPRSDIGPAVQQQQVVHPPAPCAVPLPAHRQQEDSVIFSFQQQAGITEADWFQQRHRKRVPAGKGFVNPVEQHSMQ